MTEPQTKTDAPSAPRARDVLASQALDSIRDALQGLRYGTVTAVVQDGLVVQVERTEKLRLIKSASTP